MPFSYLEHQTTQDILALTTRTPDNDERERLRRLLGPDIKAKTIQIWFQNRRSKSRAKQRQQAAKRLEEGIVDDDSGSGGDCKSEEQSEITSAGSEDAGKRNAKIDELKCLIRDGESALSIRLDTCQV